MQITFLLVIRSYWSTSWPFANESFSRVMSSRRFELLLKFLHLNNSDTQPLRGETGYDKLYKVRPFLDIVLENFKTNYQPYQQISIDESMISYKGRLSFVQYLPHKWGLKAWVLADSINGYCWGWKLYTGKEGDRTEHGLAHKVVMDDQRLDQKGYIVFTDNQVQLFSRNCVPMDSEHVELHGKTVRISQSLLLNTGFRRGKYAVPTTTVFCPWYGGTNGMFSC